MAVDFESSLPVRTQANGDVVIFIADATTPSQLTSVDTHGSLSSILRDTAGNAIGDQLISASYWLQVVTPGSGSSAPGTASSFADLVAGIYNSTPPTLTNGQQAALQLDSSGRLLVDATVTNTNDTNYGTVGANTLRTAAQIGNATGAADFNSGVYGAQTLRVVVASNQPNIATNVHDGAGTAINSQTISAAQWLDVVEPNIGATGATAPTEAALIAGVNGGNLTPIATDASGNLDVNVFSGGNPNSNTNPLYVITTNNVPGTPVNYYNATASIAASGTDSTSVYTITTGKTLSVKKVWVASSVRIRADFQTSPDGSTYTTIFTSFNSSAFPDITFDTDQLAINDSGTGSTVRVVITNDDVKPASAYITILGSEN